MVKCDSTEGQKVLEAEDLAPKEPQFHLGHKLNDGSPCSFYTGVTWVPLYNALMEVMTS